MQVSRPLILAQIVTQCRARSDHTMRTNPSGLSQNRDVHFAFSQFDCVVRNVRETVLVLSGVLNRLPRSSSWQRRDTVERC